MHANRSVALAFILLFSTAAASTLEDNGVHYQFDGGTHHDAPDHCDDGNATWSVKIGNETSGMLVPEDDEHDVYILDVNSTTLGTRVTVHVEAAEVDFQQDLGLDINVPDCASSVRDPQNQPASPPEYPEAGPGERQVQVHNMQAGGWTCDNTEWHFVINQLRGNIATPDSIYVVWTDGTNETVNLTHETNQSAHYDTTTNLDVSLHSASVVIDANWAGRFNVGSGPCNTTDHGAVFGQPATWTNQSITFTPTETGEHKVIVSYVGMRDVSTTTADLFAPRPMSCHGCFGVNSDDVQQILYGLGAE